MSATPKTDADLEECDLAVWPPGKYVTAKLARQLETELAQAKAALAAVTAERDALRGAAKAAK